MAFESYAQLRCDSCHAASEIFDLALFDRRQILQMLRVDGWIRRTGRGRMTNPGVQCPECSGEAMKARPR